MLRLFKLSVNRWRHLHEINYATSVTFVNTALFTNLFLPTLVFLDKNSGKNKSRKIHNNNWG